MDWQIFKRPVRTQIRSTESPCIERSSTIISSSTMSSQLVGKIAVVACGSKDIGAATSLLLGQTVAIQRTTILPTPVRPTRWSNRSVTTGL